MDKIRKRLSSEIGIQPAYVENKIEHGLCYFLWHDSKAVGAQCSYCNSILWLDPLLDEVLNESRPSSVPKSGDGYLKYFNQKIFRFLEKLPRCPSCGKKSYDKFVNNTSYPRYEDGTEFCDNSGDATLINKDPETVKVWWLDRA